MKHSIVGWSILFGILISSLSYPAPQPRLQHNKQMEILDKEREKLKHETDPVDRTQSDIKISGVLLTFVNTAVAEGNMEAMRDLLKEYSATIEDASHSMMSSGKDANKHPSGFKELEIALRGQIRQLEDVAEILALNRREPVERARQQATAIREDLLKALFGGPGG